MQYFSVFIMAHYVFISTNYTMTKFAYIVPERKKTFIKQEKCGKYFQFGLLNNCTDDIENLLCLDFFSFITVTVCVMVSSPFIRYSDRTLCTGGMLIGICNMARLGDVKKMIRIRFLIIYLELLPLPAFMIQLCYSNTLKIP